jgi:hypothetical protein
MSKRSRQKARRARRALDKIQKHHRVGTIGPIRPIKDGVEAVKRARPLFGQSNICEDCHKPITGHVKGYCPKHDYSQNMKKNLDCYPTNNCIVWYDIQRWEGTDWREAA